MKDRKETVEDLRMRALARVEQEKHRRKKYRHDASTANGTLLVDQELFDGLVAKVDSAEWWEEHRWNRHSIVSERVTCKVVHSSLQFTGSRVSRVGGPIRVPAKLIVDLTEPVPEPAVGETEGGDARFALSFAKWEHPGLHSDLTFGIPRHTPLIIIKETPPLDEETLPEVKKIINDYRAEQMCNPTHLTKYSMACTDDEKDAERPVRSYEDGWPEIRFTVQKNRKEGPTQEPESTETEE